jgi:hypothetical protein
VLDEDDSDDQPLLTPVSTNRRRLVKRATRIVDSDDDDNDEPFQTPKKRRLTRKGLFSPEVGTSSPGDNKAKVASPQANKEDSAADLYTRMKRGSRKSARSARSEKDKQRELLRRRRAGEAVDEEDMSSSSQEEEVKGIYDHDSDHPALEEFEDDEEEEDTQPEPAPRRPSKSTANTLEASKEGDSDDLDDFIVQDDDMPIGVPAELLDIPLEFTAHSHKPLKEHFKHAVEWLVQTKINPGFSERRHALYVMAWRKLDDEVRGLAQSKFASSAWKQDFHLALRARPYIDSVELQRGGLGVLETCMACGRRNHPATWSITFSGPAYNKNINSEEFLQDIESDSSSSESGSGSGNEAEGEDYDEDGNAIPSQDKEWVVGAVCNSNAETAHNLIHWKRALLDWVADTLLLEGYMASEKLQERENMKPKKRYKLVDKIIASWTDKGVIRALYSDFKANLETARNKTTTGKVLKGKR